MHNLHRQLWPFTVFKHIYTVSTLIPNRKPKISAQIYRSTRVSDLLSFNAVFHGKHRARRSPSDTGALPDGRASTSRSLLTKIIGELMGGLPTATLKDQLRDLSTQITYLSRFQILLQWIDGLFNYATITVRLARSSFCVGCHEIEEYTRDRI